MSRMSFSQVDIIALLQQPDYADLWSAFLLRHYSKGQLIAPDSAQKSAVFVVKHGQIRVYLSFEGREFTLTYLQSGDIFTTHANTHLSAESDTSVWLCDTHQFSHYLLSQPEFGLKIIGILGGMLSNSFQIIEQLVFADVTQRLASILLQLADNKVQDNLFDLDLTMDELAMLISSSRQTTSLLMNDLLRKGVLEKMAPRKYRIIDKQSLCELAKTSLKR